MKIVLPLQTEQIMADDFTKSSFIGVYDTGSGSFSMEPVGDTSESPESNTLMQMIKQGANYVIISPGFSVMALSVFKQYTIETYKAVGRSVEDNITLFGKKALLPFEIYQQLASNSCGTGCSSCSTSSSCVV